MASSASWVDSSPAGWRACWSARTPTAAPGVATAALTAYATLGPAFVAIAALSYVNVPGADDVFSFPVHVGTSTALAVVVGILTVYLGRPDRPVTTQVQDE